MQFRRPGLRALTLLTGAGLSASLACTAFAQPSPTPPEPAASPRPSVSSIGYLTAGDLLTRCKDSASASISYCFSYIAAVRDTMRAYEIWLGQREFCEPGVLHQGDLRQAVMGYLSAYPSARTGQAASVVVVALKQTYPCAGGSGTPPAAAPSGR